MANQLALFTDRYNRFRQFHQDNPEVFKLFAHFAEMALKQQRTRFGARMIGERIRWYSQVETTSTDYKLNDHYWPYYARLLCLTDVRFHGFFEYRGGAGDVSDATLLAECGDPKSEDKREAPEVPE